MAFTVNVVDPVTGRRQGVTARGESVVAPAAPNVSSHWTMVDVDTAYNFAPPLTGKIMRLQNILMYGNKSVGTNDASIVIYTANSPTAIDGTTILELELPKYASRDLIGINLELPEGVYLNAKTNDSTVFLTMMGYYVGVI